MIQKISDFICIVWNFGLWKAITGQVEVIHFNETKESKNEKLH